MKLGEIALWNLLTKKVIKGNDPTLDLLKTFLPDKFAEFLKGLA